MKLFSKIRTILDKHEYRHENISGGGHERVYNHDGEQNSESAGTNDYSQLLGRMQALCNTLPDGEVLLDVGTGEICMRVKWRDDSKKTDATVAKEGDSRGKDAPSLTSAATAKGESKGNEKTEGGKQTNIQKLTQYLKAHYLFRYNLLTEQTECARIETKTMATTETLCTTSLQAAGDGHLVYLPADSRLLNGISLTAMEDGIACWDRDVKRYVESNIIKEYHPFRTYFDTLPAWDGKDRVAELARRVSDNEVWTNGFHRWMLAATAQWMDFGESERANSVAPILVSNRQGMGKSTFCRMIMPKELNRYFTESYDLNAPTSAECKLATFGLINIDEFDRLSAKKMPLLKNLMQMKSLNIRKAYKRSSEPLSRIASFIGTSNRMDLLTDTTGSRRFLCVNIEKAIDCSPIDHAQLYAQLKQELMNGERYWFSKEEEKAIQTNNKPFYHTTPEEEIFRSCFRFATQGEKDARIMTAAEIFDIMKRRHGAAMRDASCHSLSRLLPTIGERIHTKYCNGYSVVDASQTIPTSSLK